MIKQTRFACLIKTKHVCNKLDLVKFNSDKITSRLMKLFFIDHE